MGGWIAIASKENCNKEARDALLDINNRGQDYCGYAALEKDIIRKEVRSGTVIKNFDYNLEGLKGNCIIGHASAKDPQPETKEGKLGKYAIVYSGNIINYKELRKEFLDKGYPFDAREKDLDIITALLFEKNNDYVSGIKNINDRIQGSYTIGILTEDGIIIARDPSGYRPLIIGEKTTKPPFWQFWKSETTIAYAVSSESCSFQHTGFKILRDVEPGEILFFNHNKLKTLEKIKGKIQKCSFECVYTANLSSKIDGLSVAEVRINIGRQLARQDKERNLQIDAVASIPMSAIGHAIGYHLESGIPLVDVFAYNRYLDRSYTPSNQKLREIIAGLKLFPIVYNIKGKRVLIADDSIRRGTQTKNIVYILKELGAKGVHLRIGSPPQTDICPFTKARDKKEDLAITKVNAKTLEEFIEKERKYLGVETLDFIDRDVFYECFYDKNTGFKIPREELCGYCYGHDNIKSLSS